MKEILKEVYSSISRHKMRSLLTGFGIAWGIFILIILLGAGNGFRAGVLNMFKDYASNSIWVTGQWVSQARIGGVQTGSRVKFNNSIISQIKNKFPQILTISSEINLENVSSIQYKSSMGSFGVKGINENYNKIKLLEISDGRYFNEIDYKERRRVVIIGGRVKETLFENENPIGKYIGISGAFFQVIGVLKEGTIMSLMEQNNIYAPNNTFQYIFNLNDDFSTFGAVLSDKTSIETFEIELRDYISEIIGFSKSDRGALFVNNIQLQVKAFNSLFDGLNVFLWSLGICFLLSGMIGVTNIMLVVVKERTKEIGIRKALGATPESIIVLIISEALISTLFFGLIGLTCGYLGIGFYNWIIPALQTGKQEVFASASIEWYIALFAFVILIVSGVLAGVFPAQKAAKIMPVEILNKAS